MQASDILIDAVLRQPTHDTFSDVVSRQNVILATTHRQYHSYCATDQNVYQLDDKPYLSLKDSERILCALAANYNLQLVVIQNSETKSCYLQCCDKPWKYQLQTQRVIQMQQCPQNERKRSLFSQVPFEFFVLDIDVNFQKLRLIDANQGEFEKVMSLDLEHLASIHQLVNEIGLYEKVILTEIAIIYKDKAYDTETGEAFNLIDQVKTLVDYRVISCERIPYSDKIMIICVCKDKQLKGCIIDEPGSRSANPIGYSAFGLRGTEKMINLGSSIFLVQFTGCQEDVREFERSRLTVDQTSHNNSSISSRYASQLMTRRQEINDEQTLLVQENEEDSRFLKKISNMMDIDGSYWCLMGQTDVYSVSDKLREFLDDAPWQRMSSCLTVTGICKVAVSINNGYSEPRAKILELTSDGEYLREREFIMPVQTGWLIQVEILMNYGGDEICLLVKKQANYPAYDTNENQIDHIKISESDDCQSIEIESDSILQCALVGRKLFYLKPGQKTIEIYDIDKRKQVQGLDLTKYWSLQSAAQCSDILIQACSPHQIMRTSHNSKLDRDNMIDQSNFLQVTANDVAYIFDCKDPAQTHLIKSMTNLSKFHDPETFIESGFTIYETDDKSESLSQLQLNPSGATVVQSYKQGEQSSRIIGLYKTFSKLSLLKIDDMQRNLTTRNLISQQTLFTLYGEQTIFGIFKSDLRLIEKIRHTLENETHKQEIKQVDDNEYCTYSFKLAQILTLNTYDSSKVHDENNRIITKQTNLIDKVAELKFLDIIDITKTNTDDVDDKAELTSTLRQSLSDTSLREILSNIGDLSPAYSIFNVLRSQTDWSLVATSNTNRSNAELQDCFRQTAYTAPIKTLCWPEALDMHTFTRQENIIEMKEIQKMLDDNYTGQFVTRNVRVRMMDMRWFFHNGQNFVLFSKLLEKQPNKVYTSLLLQSLLNQYWTRMQRKILRKQFLPYLAFAPLTIHYFTALLKPGAYEEKVTISFLILPLWVYLVYNEVLQMISLRIDYLRSPWNLVDISNLSLTFFLILASYDIFEGLLFTQIRSIASVVGCLNLLKFFDWFRLFEKTAFFVQLLEQTLFDIKDFMILVFFALLIFGVPMYILDQNRIFHPSIVYHASDFWVWDILINQYVLALGEFMHLDAFGEGPQTNLCYVFFGLSTFIIQITMFNMLIGIMGDTFENMIENRLVNSTKSKLQLMSELIAVIGKEVRQEDKNRFFFIAQPESDDQGAVNDEWEGTIKSIQKVVNKNAQKMFVKQENLQNCVEESTRNVSLHNILFKKQIEQVKTNILDMRVKLEKKIESNHEKIEEKTTNLQEKTARLDEKMISMQNMLQKIHDKVVDDKEEEKDNESLDKPVLKVFRHRSGFGKKKSIFL